MSNVTTNTARRFLSLFAGAALAVAALVVAPPAEAQRRGTPGAEATEESVAPSADGVVNIQTASADELQRLPGIGPSKAAAIIAFRDRTPFQRVEDILRVRGIGRATFRNLRPMMTVSGPTTLAGATRAARTPRTPSASE